MLLLCVTYQYKREPLTSDEANRLANACKTHEEKLVVWTLLDTGLRVAELANLTQDTSTGKQHRLVIYSKAGPMASYPNEGLFHSLCESSCHLKDT
jgi:integrase/recombinase XerD